jgi:cadmium resistance protein CadD (predicted permease)
MEENNKKYPEGHFIGIWMAIGIAIFTAFGIPFSITTENPGMIGIWPALGVAIGLSIGQAIENKYKKKGKIRPLTEEEKKRKKIGVTAGLMILLIGAFVGLLIFLKLL